MAQKLNLNRFKSSGVYTVEIDESQNIALPLGTGRLIIGSSKRGPINTVVALSDLNSALAVYGERDTKLESKGSYFHRTLEVALRKGPVYALNVLPTDDTLDKVTFATFNTESASFNSDFDAIAFEQPLSSFFNTQKLWYADEDQFNRTKNNALSSEDDNKIFSIVNLGKRPVTVWAKLADVAGYDVTVKEYYKITGGDKVTIPTYLHPDDIVADYLVELIAVEGDWTDNVRLANDPVYKSYFNERGIIMSKINGFLNLREVKNIARVNGSLIPQFKDASGADISIDRVFNRLFSQTELFCALDENKIELIDLETAFANASMDSHRIDLAGHGYMDLIAADFQDYYIDNGFTGDYTDANAKLDVLGYKAPVKNTAVFEVTTGLSDSCRVVTENGNQIIIAREGTQLYKAWYDGFIVTGNGFITTQNGTTASKYVKVESGFTELVNLVNKSYIKVKCYDNVALTNQSATIPTITVVDTFVKLSLDLHAAGSTTKVFDFANELVANNSGSEITTTKLALNKIEMKVLSSTSVTVGSASPVVTASNAEYLAGVTEFVKPNHYVKAKSNSTTSRSRFLRIVSVAGTDEITSSSVVTPAVPAVNETGIAVDAFIAAAATITLSAANANIVAGCTVSGTGIAPNTTVTNKTGLVLTLSTPTTAVSGGTYTFTKAGVAAFTTVTAKTYKKFTVTTLVPSDSTIIGIDIDTNMIFHKGVKNYITSSKGVVLSGFSMRDAQLPNGTASRQADILGWLYENTNIASTLAEGQAVDFRYIIDTYEGEISGSSKYYLAKIAADNGQCLAILNAPSYRQLELSTEPSFADVTTKLVSAKHIADGGNLDLNPTTTLKFVDEEINGVPMGSYAAYFMPNLIVNDNGRNKSVPPAAYVSNAFMNKFEAGRPFSIVAGKNGILGDPEIVNVEYELSQEDRDYLEPAGYNLIVRRRGFGIMVFTNNTAYQKINSALNNTHVREALATIEKDIERILFNFLFDFNDEITRLRIKTLVEGYLERAKNAQGVSSYTVVFDSTNNGPEVLSANSAIIDVFLDFPRGIHKFINRITITRVGGGLASEATGFIPSF
jgi:hypothetical protein